METGQAMQIVVTVIAIIGAAAVAFVCDMLRMSNERLHRANLELRTRTKYEQRRADRAVEQLRQLTRPQAATAVAHEEPEMRESEFPLRDRSYGRAISKARRDDASGRGELIPFESLQTNADPTHLPPGFHQSEPFVRVLNSHTPFSGS
jgi:hypothetical protein